MTSSTPNIDRYDNIIKHITSYYHTVAPELVLATLLRDYLGEYAIFRRFFVPFKPHRRIAADLIAEATKGVSLPGLCKKLERYLKEQAPSIKRSGRFFGLLSAFFYHYRSIAPRHFERTLLGKLLLPTIEARYAFQGKSFRSSYLI